MTFDRANYSYLERLRATVAEIETKLAAGESAYGGFADEFYQARQTRMDETARAVLANLWAMNRPPSNIPDFAEQANQILQHLANESWQIALALEQTRIGYDCRAMQGKREQELAASKVVNNVD